MSWSWSPASLQYFLQLEFRCLKEPRCHVCDYSRCAPAACLARACLTRASTAFPWPRHAQGCSIWTDVLLPRRIEALGPTPSKSILFVLNLKSQGMVVVMNPHLTASWKLLRLSTEFNFLQNTAFPDGSLE